MNPFSASAIQREFRARRARIMLATSASLVISTVLAAMATGLYLKQERKVTVAVHAGCYRWSDGTVTCQRGWKKLTDDMVYGCSWVNADPATGECK